MSKSILVIDTPENCDECRLMREHFDHCYGWIKECIGSGIDDCIVFKRKLEDYCPLKPMPSKKAPVFDPNSSSYDEEYEKRIIDEISGWNECINEILGEK
jgi:hypothetical protein